MRQNRNALLCGFCFPIYWTGLKKEIAFLEEKKKLQQKNMDNSFPLWYGYLFSLLEKVEWLRLVRFFFADMFFIGFHLSRSFYPEPNLFLY